MNTPHIIKFKLQSFTVHDPSSADGKTYRNGVPMRTCEDVFRVAAPIFAELDADKEQFLLFALNNKNRLIGFKVISTGSLTASLVHPREVYRAALFFDAAAVVFAHNHPSGDPQPSQEDIEITRRLKQCGELFGLRVLDHIVYTPERYFSFSDKGML